MITEQQIKEAADNSVNGMHKSFDGIEIMLAHAGFEYGAEWAIKQLQPKWIPVIKDELLPAGYYYLKLYQPDTKIEDIITFRINGVAGKITYHFAIEYCRLTEPPNH